MRMIRTLLLKELSQHGWLFLALLPFCTFGFLMTLAVGQMSEAGSPLEAARLFGTSLLLLVEVVLCNRLVVQEFTGKTQLFLEGLPISRVGLIATKYGLGLAVVLLMLAFCLGSSLIVASREEIISRRFVAILSVRLGVFAYCTYAFFFMMGLLGRYRIVLYLLAIMIVTVVSRTTNFDFELHGPLGLINSQFAFERNVFPTTTLLICGAVGMVFTIIALVMAVLREGTVASMLAERMSQREKLFVSAVMLGTIFTITTVQSKQTPDPYTILGAISSSGKGVSVYVERVTDDEQQIQEFADRVHRELVEVSEYLQIDGIPPLFIVHRSDLDADRYELADLENASGILVRVNFLSSEWSLEDFLPWLLDVCLSEATQFNAIREPQCWVLEGFVQYWNRRKTDPAVWSDTNKWDLRAAYGASLGISTDDITNWYSYRERVGAPIASAVACAGLVRAEQQYGAESLRRFLCEVLRSDLPRDSRALFTQWRRPVDVAWQDAFASDYQPQLAKWIDDLGVFEDQFAASIAEVPRVQATSEMNALSRTSYEVIVTAQMSPTSPEKTWTIQYESIDVVDLWTSDDQVTAQVIERTAGTSGTIKERFPFGSRLRWTVSVHSPILDCDVISGWNRQEVK